MNESAILKGKINELLEEQAKTKMKLSGVNIENKRNKDKIRRIKNFIEELTGEYDKDITDYIMEIIND